MINFSVEFQFNNTCDIPFRIEETQPTPPCECPEGVILYNITSYTENSVTFDSNVYYFRNPTSFGICDSDNSNGCDYITTNGSYIIGGNLGYLFTFEVDEIIPSSIGNLGKLYLI
jgi:hypothetical protein